MIHVVSHKVCSVNWITRLCRQFNEVQHFLHHLVFLSIWILTIQSIGEELYKSNCIGLQFEKFTSYCSYCPNPKLCKRLRKAPLAQANFSSIFLLFHYFGIFLNHWKVQLKNLILVFKRFKRCYKIIYDPFEKSFKSIYVSSVNILDHMLTFIVLLCGCRRDSFF